MERRTFIKQLGSVYLISIIGINLLRQVKRLKICFAPEFSKYEREYLFDLIKEKVNKSKRSINYEYILQIEEAEPNTQDQDCDYIQVYSDVYKDRKKLYRDIDYYRNYLKENKPKGDYYKGSFYLCLIERKEITFDNIV